MNTQQTAPHLEAIIRALGDRVGTELTHEEVEAEFQRYLEYGVPPEQAKRTILRHYGVSAASAGGSDERTPLADVTNGMNHVNLLVRLVFAENKTITVRGEPKEITGGLLADETMTRSFTSWSPIDFVKGDTLKVTGAYTRSYRGEPEIQFGDRVQLEKVDDAQLPADIDSVRPFKVHDLKPGVRNVEVTARILSVGAKEVRVKDEPKTVWSGTIGDGTGKVQFSAWKDFDLTDGQLVKISGAYVRGWRGTPQLTFDDGATVESVTDESFPSTSEIDDAGPVPIGRFLAGPGAVDVVVEGSVLEIRPGSGLIERCPECNRALQQSECGLHGRVDGTPDLRVKAVLDDGTGALTALLNRELTESVLGKTLADAQALAKETATGDVLVEALRTRLVARTWRMRGNVLTDEYGPMLLVQSLDPVQRDVTAAAEALLAELEGAA